MHTVWAGRLLTSREKSHDLATPIRSAQKLIGLKTDQWLMRRLKMISILSLIEVRTLYKNIVISHFCVRLFCVYGLFCLIPPPPSLASPYMHWAYSWVWRLAGIWSRWPAVQFRPWNFTQFPETFRQFIIGPFIRSCICLATEVSNATAPFHHVNTTSLLE